MEIKDEYFIGDRYHIIIARGKAQISMPGSRLSYSINMSRKFGL